MNYFENDASKDAPLPKYNECLRADVFSVVTQGAPRAAVHSSEWAKVMAGAWRRAARAARAGTGPEEAEAAKERGRGGLPRRED